MIGIHGRTEPQISPGAFFRHARQRPLPVCFVEEDADAEIVAWNKQTPSMRIHIPIATPAQRNLHSSRRVDRVDARANDKKKRQRHVAARNLKRTSGVRFKNRLRITALIERRPAQSAGMESR